MTVKYPRIEVTLPPHRVIWSNVWEGRELDEKAEQGKAQRDYGYCAIFDQPDEHTPQNRVLWDEVTAAAQRVKAEAFPNGVPSDYRGPFFDGTKYNDDRVAKGKQRIKEIEGKLCMNLKSKNRPVPVRNGCNPTMAPEVFNDKGKFYSGCYAIATGSFYAYDNKSYGMAFGLDTVLKIADGQPIVGGADPVEKYKEVNKKVDLSQYAKNQDLLNSDRPKAGALDL